jgi:hypothetical protein
LPEERTIDADESTAWNELHGGFAIPRSTINMDTASTMPALTKGSPISPAPAVARLGITITLPGFI